MTVLEARDRPRSFQPAHGSVRRISFERADCARAGMLAMRLSSDDLPILGEPMHAALASRLRDAMRALDPIEHHPAFGSERARGAAAMLFECAHGAPAEEP